MLHVECTGRVARWLSAGQWWVEVYLPWCLIFNTGWCVMVLDVVGQEIYGGLEWSAPLTSRDDAEAQLRLSSFRCCLAALQHGPMATPAPRV